MAKLLIKDLKEDVELDREAMASIMGGRGPAHRRVAGIGTAAIAGSRPLLTGTFSKHRRNRFAR
jgi:hypothetical protein